MKLGNVSSPPLPIKFGVPQGSILGPLLFLIFINDLPNATNFFIKLFADDTFLCNQNTDITVLEKETNTEIEKVYNWLVSNKLTLNISKSKFMLISNKKSIKKDFCVSIDGSPLEKCDEYKYLGVIIDKNLNWKSHIEYVSTKISKACGILSKLRHFLSSQVLIEVYHALIHSYLRYGILVWGNASDTTLKPLETLINRSLRIMTFAPFGRIDMKPIFKDLKILDVKNTLFLETSKYMFKVKNNLLPVQIAKYFETNEHSSRTLRSNVRRNNRVFTRLLSSKKSVQVRGENQWNEIPENLKLATSVNSFKRLIKNMLIENY